MNVILKIKTAAGKLNSTAPIKINNLNAIFLKFIKIRN